jgi:N6-adenosine-specific RNA methylase IME4
MFADLTPPYSTIVADPPWHYAKVNPDKDREGYRGGGLPYSSMTVPEIAAMPVRDLADPDGCRVFLWITNRYLRHGWEIIESWGFRPAERVFVRTKAPRATTPVTTEYLMLGSLGSPAPMPWLGTTWFAWPRIGLAHSQKPPAALDLIESMSPGPRVELFARSPRLGWDSWGHGYETERAS